MRADGSIEVDCTEDEEGNLIEFMVMLKDPISGIEGLGRRSFWTVPRSGEYVQLSDQNGKAQMYMVKAVCHAEGNAPTAGDIIVELVGSEAYVSMLFRVYSIEFSG